MINNSKSNSFINEFMPEKTFLILALIFGLLFAMLVPVFRGRDEPAHFYRAYQLSEFIIIAPMIKNVSGGYIPKDYVKIQEDLGPSNDGEKAYIKMQTDLKSLSINEKKRFISKKISERVPTYEFKKYKNIKINFQDKKFVKFPNTVLYSPIVYLPHILGLKVAKITNSTLLLSFFFVRIFNLLAFIVVVYFSIKITPLFKWGFVFIALAPLTLYLASSGSADVMNISLCFLFIAFVLNYAFSENIKRITNKQILYLSIIAFLIGLCKPVYSLVPFIFLLIPYHKFKSKKNFFLGFLVVIFSCLASSILWNLAIKNIYVPMKPYVNPQSQLNYLITHPIFAIDLFLNSFIKVVKKMPMDLREFSIMNRLPYQFAYFYFSAILLHGILESKKTTINLHQKIISAIILVASVLYIEFSIYLSWNPVGWHSIRGVHGRYLFPILPLFLILLYNTRINLSKKYKKSFEIISILILFLSLLYAFSRLVIRYYILTSRLY